MEARAVKSRGRGWEDKAVSLDGRPALLESLRERPNLDPTVRRDTVLFARIDLLVSLLSEVDLAEVGPVAGLP